MEATKTKKYNYNSPLYFVGDTVQFENHKRNLEIGQIVHVTTKYGYNYNAYHVYSIMMEGKQRRVHIAERYILFQIGL